MTARLLLLAATLAAGCSTEFDPRVGTDTPYALYGRLDGMRARQQLRVESLQAPLGTDGPLDGTVTSENLATGETLVWADSLVTLTDGTPAHLAVAPLAVRPGGAYRIVATRTADGAVSRATVRIDAPTVATAGVSPGSTAVQTLTVRGLARTPEDVAVEYRARRTDTGAEATLRTTYNVATRPGGADVFVDLGADARRLRGLLGVDEDAPAGAVAVVSAQVTATARSAAPVPVENGVGGIEWVVPVSLPFRVDAALLARVRLADAQSP